MLIITWSHPLQQRHALFALVWESRREKPNPKLSNLGEAEGLGQTACHPNIPTKVAD